MAVSTRALRTNSAWPDAATAACSTSIPSARMAKHSVGLIRRIISQRSGVFIDSFVIAAVTVYHRGTDEVRFSHVSIAAVDDRVFECQFPFKSIDDEDFVLGQACQRIK